MPGAPATTFANHRGVVPLLWAFVALAACELVGVHLLVSLWSHRAAWALSAVTALSLLWLVQWVISWKRLPHELHADHLRLHMGSLRHLDIPLARIAGLHACVNMEVLQGPGTRNLVPVAFPNRVIELCEPLPDRRGTQRIALRFDDPEAFDAALKDVLGARCGESSLGRASTSSV